MRLQIQSPKYQAFQSVINQEHKELNQNQEEFQVDLANLAEHLGDLEKEKHQVVTNQC